MEINSQHFFTVIVVIVIALIIWGYIKYIKITKKNEDSCEDEEKVSYNQKVKQINIESIDNKPLIIKKIVLYDSNDDVITLTDAKFDPSDNNILEKGKTFETNGNLKILFPKVKHISLIEIDGENFKQMELIGVGKKLVYQKMKKDGYQKIIV